jgi:hypothetical protein
MTIPASAIGTPIPRPTDQTPFVNENGNLTAHGLQLLTAYREFIVGMSRIIPCSASGTNVITLTPNTASPLLEKYLDFDVFPFVAAANSTGAVTMTVVPRKGTLATLKAYITNGSAQANTGDLTAGLFYQAWFVDSLDSGAGGFVIY